MLLLLLVLLLLLCCCCSTVPLLLVLLLFSSAAAIAFLCYFLRLPTAFLAVPIYSPLLLSLSRHIHHFVNACEYDR
jgi:hypothetical protein